MSAVARLLELLTRERVRIALLDCDGCLTASNGWWHGQLIAEALSRLGLDVSEAVALQAYTGPGHGVDYFELLRLNLFERYFKVDASRYLSEFRKELLEVSRELKEGILNFHVEPLPGVVNFLEGLQCSGIPAVVVTMTPTRLAEAILTRAGIRPLVGEIVGCDVFAPAASDPRDLAPRGFAAQVEGYRKDQAELWSATAEYFGGCRLEESFGAEDGALGTAGLSRGNVSVLALLKQKCVSSMENPLRHVYVTTADHDWMSLERI